MPLLRPLFAFLLILTACASPSAGDSRAAVATVYPLGWLVGEIAPDLEVASLAARGQDPHDLELSPQQRAAVETAALVVYLGDIGFQPQVEAAIPAARGEVVNAASVLGDALRPPDDEPGADAVDPHVWFDARLMAQLATAIGEAAAAADPTGAAGYRRNAEATARRLEDLADEVADLLSSCRHDTVVVSHEAYQYLLEPAGLEQRGISGPGGHTAASPRDISDLAALVRDERLPAVLTEPVDGRTDAEAVAAEAGVELIEIYSLDVVDDAQAAKGYPALLREQAQAVARAAECGG